MNRFQRTRQDHQLETTEDYVELIDSLTREKGEARAVDLAQRLGVSPVTVGKTLQRLARDGFVRAERYRAVFLTELGQGLAERCRARHDLVLRFLLAVGVPADSAEPDAEGIEHHVSEATLAAMRRFLER